jgi:hypothetical protein
MSLLLFLSFLKNKSIPNKQRQRMNAAAVDLQANPGDALWCVSP